MPWLQIKLEINPDSAERYEDILLEAGCAAVTYQDSEDQPIFEPDLGTTPLWQRTTISGLFDTDYDMAATEAFIREAHSTIFKNSDFPTFSAEILEDKDWEREWMKNYHPMQFGQRLWICPSWREAPDPNAVNLMLDPGLAFGTGTHPTTALCLEWLDAQTLEGKKVTDYGCGSGILGIAALLLGADHVIAVDIDIQAIQATRDNLGRNKLSDDRLDAYLPESAPQAATDVLVANILAGPLVELAPTLAERVKPGGLLALSGLLIHQADEIIQAYSPWFDLDPVAEREEWIRVTGVKR
ncbi:50S ribosomal protein L11 methyltransferase [Neptunomonas phycophila]|jgi:ribosomal protein L11 methyltransferase|uniref:Ribosomal protein L11 methyltransferase n=1 Tax=Neptunomonas phycophila TaxID=1572645 RepID=A0AAW7XF81_9GAMM|nr:50S ribosomal protein L11 methyltransferase [Neptunomonas phycophila]MDO6452871.1 50S ribosomal protein L11 methyltransferase [Neptunomonas phycophila]MDP2521497.1 50S ribosomal protein L11 methyltransferase [Neptunomonas phycophila]